MQNDITTCEQIIFSNQKPNTIKQISISLGMGRGTLLTELERGQILAYRDENRGIREISRLMGRNHATIISFLRDPENYGSKKSPGRPQKLSPQEKRRISKIASNSSKSCRQIATETGSQASRWTVLRAIHNTPNLKSASRFRKRCKPMKKKKVQADSETRASTQSSKDGICPPDGLRARKLGPGLKSKNFDFEPKLHSFIS